MIQNSIDSISNSNLKNKPWIKIALDFNQESNQVKIKIIDNGQKPSSQVQSQMFEPFFTTKTLGDTLGMSLPLAKNIMQNHNGKLEYVAELEDTTFELILPKIL